MFNLSGLRSLLFQVLSLPALHTAVLFTPEGHLISYAADALKSKDDIRIIVGVGAEVWQETKEQGVGMADSELGRVLVLPIEQARREPGEEEEAPLMLLALNAHDSVEWKELELKARELAKHLERPVAQLRGRLSSAPTSPLNHRAERAPR